MFEITTPLDLGSPTITSRDAVIAVTERSEIYAERTGPLDGSGPYGVVYDRRPLATVRNRSK